MGVTKISLRNGVGEHPGIADVVVTAYIGYVRDTSKPDDKGELSVNSSTRSPS